MLHIQVQLLNSPEIRGELLTADRWLGAINILVIFKAKSLDEITKG